MSQRCYLLLSLESGVTMWLSDVISCHQLLSSTRYCLQLHAIICYAWLLLFAELFQINEIWENKSTDQFDLSSFSRYRSINCGKQGVQFKLICTSCLNQKTDLGNENARNIWRYEIDLYFGKVAKLGVQIKLGLQIKKYHQTKG